VSQKGDQDDNRESDLTPEHRTPHALSNVGRRAKSVSEKYPQWFKVTLSTAILEAKWAI
jgi:hypothetical protein